MKKNIFYCEQIILLNKLVYLNFFCKALAEFGTPCPHGYPILGGPPHDVFPNLKLGHHWFIIFTNQFYTRGMS